MIKKISFIIATLFCLSACGQKAADVKQQNDSMVGKEIPPISVQLWSVREFVKNDFKGTLTKISEMGYEGVEFARDYGPYGDDPEALVEFLNSINLKVSGVHIGTPDLMGPDVDKHLDFFKRMGAKLVIIPADKRAWGGEKIDEFVKDMNMLQSKLAAEGLTLMYHNHAQEFDAFGDGTYWDYIARNTSMGLELDVGWVNYAGADAVEYVKRYPNRTFATHIKIRTKGATGVNTILGQTDYDWAKLVDAQVNYGGLQWLVVEQEEHPEGYNFMTAIEASRKGLLAELNAK